MVKDLIFILFLPVKSWCPTLPLIEDWQNLSTVPPLFFFTHNIGSMDIYIFFLFLVFGEMTNLSPNASTPVPQ